MGQAKMKQRDTFSLGFTAKKNLLRCRCAFNLMRIGLPKPLLRFRSTQLTFRGSRRGAVLRYQRTMQPVSALGAVRSSPKRYVNTPSYSPPRSWRFGCCRGEKAQK